MFYRDNDTQLITLKIILQLLKKLEYNQIIFFLENILSIFPSHTNPNCRISFLFF